MRIFRKGRVFQDHYIPTLRTNSLKFRPVRIYHKECVFNFSRPLIILRTNSLKFNQIMPTFVESTYTIDRAIFHTTTALTCVLQINLSIFNLCLVTESATISNKRFTSTATTLKERPAKPSVLQQHQNVAYAADDAITAASPIHQKTLGREDRSEHEGIRDKGLF